MPKEFSRGSIAFGNQGRNPKEKGEVRVAEKRREHTNTSCPPVNSSFLFGCISLPNLREPRVLMMRRSRDLEGSTMWGVGGGLQVPALLVAI